MDNAPSHKSNLVKDIFRKSKVKIFFNAPYSPDLNPIEFIFSIMKTSARRKPFKSLSDVFKHVNEIAKKISLTKVKNCIRHSRSLYENVLMMKDL